MFKFSIFAYADRTRWSVTSPCRRRLLSPANSVFSTDLEERCHGLYRTIRDFRNDGIMREVESNERVSPIEASLPWSTVRLRNMEPIHETSSPRRLHKDSPTCSDIRCKCQLLGAWQGSFTARMLVSKRHLYLASAENRDSGSQRTCRIVPSRVLERAT